MYYVYVLQNEITGKIYIGQTIDLIKRLEQHNNKELDKTSYTSINKGRWDVVYKEEVETRADALKREKELKSSRGRAFIHKTILGR